MEHGSGDEKEKFSRPLTLRPGREREEKNRVRGKPSKDKGGGK